MIPLFRGFWGQGIRYQGYFGDPRYNSHRKSYNLENILMLELPHTQKKVIVLLIFIEFEQTKHQNDQNAPYKHAP